MCYKDAKTRRSIYWIMVDLTLRVFISFADAQGSFGRALLREWQQVSIEFLRELGNSLTGGMRFGPREIVQVSVGAFLVKVECNAASIS